MKKTVFLYAFLTLSLITPSLQPANRTDYTTALHNYEKTITQAQEQLETNNLKQAHACICQASSHLTALLNAWYEDRQSTLRKKNAQAWMNLSPTESGEKYLASLQDKLTAANEAFSDKLCSTCSCLQVTTKDVATFKGELINIQQALDAKGAIVTSRESELTELRKKQIATQHQFKEAQETIKVLAQDLQTARKENELATINLHATQIEQHDKCATLEKAYKTACTERDVARDTLKNEIDGHCATKKGCEQEKAHIKELEARIVEQDAIIASLEKKIKDQHEIVTVKLEKECAHIKDHAQNLEKELATCQTRIGELQKELSASTDQVTRLEQENKTLKHTHDTLAQEKAQLAATQEEIVKEKDLLQEEADEEKEKAEAAVLAMKKEIKKSSLNLALACNTLKGCLLDKNHTTFARLQEIVDNQIAPDINHLKTMATAS